MRCPHCDQAVDVRLLKPGAGAAQSDREKSPQIANKAEVGEVLDRIRDENLETGFEMKFVRETRERWNEWGLRIKFSEAQMSTLRRIADERGS